MRELQVVEDLAEMKERSFTRQYDPSVTAQVLAGGTGRIGASSFAAGDVATVETSEDYLAFDVEMEGDGFVVDTDQYYQGWTAAVDGVETPIYQVNGFMRGVKVPAGSHRLEFRYAAPGPARLPLALPGMLPAGPGRPGLAGLHGRRPAFRYPLILRAPG